MNNNYGSETQELLISFMISDRTAYAQSQNIIMPEYFDPQLQSAVKFIGEYADQYKVLPTTPQISAETGIDVPHYPTLTSDHTQWYLETIEAFCRYKAMENVIIDGPDLLNKGAAGEMEKRFRDAMTISLMKDLGTSYFEDPAARLNRLKDKSDYFTTGMKSLDDKLYGGFSKGALNIFVGGSGCVIAGTLVYVKRVGSEEIYSLPIEELRGVNDGDQYLAHSPDGWVPVEQWRNKGEKDCFLLKVGNESIEASHDHLFQKPSGEWVYTRDLSQGDYLLCDTGPQRIMSIKPSGTKTVYDLAIGHENHRYFTNGICSHNSGKSLFLQNIALNWALRGLNVIYFSLELSEDLVSMRIDSMTSNYSTKDILKSVNKVAHHVIQAGKGAGDLRIKKVPEAGTTTNDLRAYVKEYEIKMGVKVDAIAVDYLDLMHPNNKNVDINSSFNKDKYVSEELRALAGELGVLFVTASQLNRQSVEAAEYDHSHIAGGISKINTADNVFGIFATAAMKEKGEYQLQFLKTRSSASVGGKITLAYDKDSLRITDMPVGHSSTYMPPPKLGGEALSGSMGTSINLGNDFDDVDIEPVDDHPLGETGNKMDDLMKRIRR